MARTGKATLENLFLDDDEDVEPASSSRVLTQLDKRLAEAVCEGQSTITLGCELGDIYGSNALAGFE